MENIVGYPTCFLRHSHPWHRLAFVPGLPSYAKGA